MLKDIEQHKIRKGLGNNDKVYVKQFSGANIEHMKSYVIPSKSFDNDLVILHVGTNDLREKKTAKEIATNIIDLAIDMKTDKNDIMVSGIIPRKDEYNVKGLEVNSCVYNECTMPTLADVSVGVDDGEKSPKVTLSELRVANGNNVIIAHLNINSLQNKFEALKLIVQGNIDVLVISETKIDESFPLNQFLIEGFATPFRADRNSHGGGIIIYIREGIPCKELKRLNLPKDIEGIFIELNINKSKWFLMGGYNPSKDSISYFLNHIGKVMDANLSDYENIILIGDFNAVSSDIALREFCSMYNLKNIITEPTCYKNPDNPSSIDVILTNRPRSFQESMTLETGLSDFHKIICTVLKSDFKKKDPILVNYRSYKHFDDLSFRTDLKHDLQT